MSASSNRSSFELRPARIPDDNEGMLAVLETANMHHLPSPEMHGFDLGEWHVAVDADDIIGVGGYRLLEQDDELVGKTTLLAVAPRARGLGVGGALQRLRMQRMREAGASRVLTNADRPETIAWYERHFGYRRIGEVKKLHEFGLPDVDRWTTLEAALRPPTDSA